jgi:hypothetical protein
MKHLPEIAEKEKFFLTARVFFDFFDLKGEDFLRNFRI